MTPEEAHEKAIDDSLVKLIESFEPDRRRLQADFYRLMSQRTPETVEEMEKARLERCGL